MMIPINFSKGTQNGKELRLREFGMSVYAKKNEFGNLLAKVKIVLPEHLSEEEISLFKKLAAFRNQKFK
jgi:curved DNA-binding protein